jgi:hypothetical protein
MRNTYLFPISFFFFTTIILHLNTNAQSSNDSVSISSITQQKLQNKVDIYCPQKRIKQTHSDHCIYKNSIAISALPILLDNNNQYLPKSNISMYLRNPKVEKYILSPKFNFLYKKIIKNNLFVRLGGKINWYNTNPDWWAIALTQDDSNSVDGVWDFSHYLDYSVSFGIEKKLLEKSRCSLAYGCDLNFGHIDYWVKEYEWGKYQMWFYHKESIDNYFYISFNPFVSVAYKLSNRVDLSLQSGLSFLIGRGTHQYNSDTFSGIHNYSNSMIYKKTELPANTTALFISYRF